ncbi:MAG: ABC transporter permease [Tissierellia bacterium]|nr:ABC transporter permease [Bacillota bacterium]NLL23494.1 ABC transporter permease [Tissierellia bacterium]
MLSMFLISLEQGLIFAVLALGVYITYKILDFPDLSVEGSFPAGAFAFAKLVTSGASLWAGLLGSLFIGALTGLITSLIFSRLRIKPLLSGILTLTLMYSVNLRINGKSNVPLFSTPTLFRGDILTNIVILAVIVLILKLLMDRFFRSQVGYMLLATGDNEVLVAGLGENVDTFKTVGLMISNALVALSGAIMAQNVRFADINMGASIIVIALASIIIGDTFMKNSRKIKGTTRAIYGALIYKMIGGAALYLGLAPTDLKAVNALIVIAFIAYNQFSPGSWWKRFSDKLLDRENSEGVHRAADTTS